MTNTKILENLKNNSFFNTSSHIISNYSFAYSTRFFAFPSFDVKRLFLGQVALLIRLKSFDPNNIDYYIDLIEKLYYDNEFVLDKKISTCLTANGLSLIGFYSNDRDYYLAVSLQPEYIDSINPSFILKGYKELEDNLKLRSNLLYHKEELSVKDFSIIEKEFLSLKQINIPFLLKDKKSYVEYLKDYFNKSIIYTIKLANYIIDKINEVSIKKIKGMDFKILQHFNLINSYDYCMCQKLNNSAIVYYNINEGFGLIKNDNIGHSFLIPTSLLKNNTINEHIVPPYKIATSSNIKNYSLEKFSTKEQFIELIKKRAQSLKLKSDLVYEEQQFKPLKIFIG